ncbi:MAG: M20/M25/M40 family metallo-hydrolase [Salinarimonadaceae bacterium]|nr:MAG: M20/M25/M40 family metallo-hydrolase [Salinarimonadaceae bacterium]
MTHGDARGDDSADALGLLKELIAAQRAGESAVQDIISSRLAAAGCVVEVQEFDPASVPVVGEFATGEAQTSGMRANVIGRLPGDPALRSLLMFAHPDSEPMDTATTWTRDPFAGEEVDGRIYGWGVADDLAGIAAGVAAVARARADGRPLGEVVMISAPSKRHARGVAAALHAGYVADAALYLHPAESGAGLNEIKAFASGHLEFRITVEGRLPDTNEPSHTAFAHLAVNPLDKAVLVLAALRALDEERGARITHPALQARVGRSTNLLVSHLRCGHERKFGRIAPDCVIGAALSFPPGETLDEVKAAIAEAVAKAGAADPWLAEHPPRIEWLSGVTGAECPPAHPLYRTTAAAVERVTGSAPHVNPMHTSSDIRNPIVQKGIPTVAIGGLCGDLTHNGRRDEWVDREDYLKTVSATTGILLDWCGNPKVAAH